MKRGPGVRLWSRLYRGDADSLSRNWDQDERQILDSVREHLTWLLNSRQGDTPACPDYGLPDLTGTVAGLPRSERAFCANVERTILKHEPRISWVRVRVEANDTPGARVHFTVECLLKSPHDQHRQRLSGEVDIDSVFTFQG